jgi:dTDP-4-amino-4,6-dideoxygalactose transaminase
MHYPRLRLYTRASHYARVASELLSRKWREGDSVGELESRVADKLGVNHALAMPMARTGIYYAIRALVEPGKKVILSPYTISDVVNMVICAGAVPVFADIEEESCNIDPKQVEDLIDDDTGAVLVTHFYGLTCDVERIARLCRERGVPLIEDAAQAFGAKVAGKPAGTIGDVGIFSFGLYKNLQTFYGGMLVTRDARVYETIRRWMAAEPYVDRGFFLGKVVQGAITDIITWPPVFSVFTRFLFRYAFLNDVAAINNRLKIDVDPKLKTEIPREYLGRFSPLQARIALSQLDNIEAETDERIARARLYHEGLVGTKGITLPPFREDRSHIYWYYPIQHPKRHELVAYAMRQGCDLTESHHRNCADLACFQQFHRDCPKARKAASSVVYLPTYPGYPLRDVRRNIEAVRSYLSSC